MVPSSVFPQATKWTVDTFYLAKVSSVMLLLLIYSAFCDQVSLHLREPIHHHRRTNMLCQFANDAFTQVSTATILFIVFVNFGLYLGFTAVCLVLTRLPGIKTGSIKEGGRIPLWRRMVLSARFGKPEGELVNAEHAKLHLRCRRTKHTLHCLFCPPSYRHLLLCSGKEHCCWCTNLEHSIRRSLPAEQSNPVDPPGSISSRTGICCSNSGQHVQTLECGRGAQKYLGGGTRHCVRRQGVSGGIHGRWRNQ